MTWALELDGVTRRFGRRTALDGATLAVPAGRAVCLVGGNGAGKTTLLAVAAGVLAPDAGRVSVFGRSLDASADVRRGIGYVADAPLVYDALSGRENLRFFARLYRLRGAGPRIVDLLHRVGLEDRADDPAGTYSAGMRRRLDLARAVLHEPQLLLLDEPATALDAEGRAVLRELIDEYRSAPRAVLMATHDTAGAAEWSDSVIEIERGRVAAGGVAAAGRSDREGRP